MKLLLALLLAASSPRHEWLGAEMPLPLAVRTPQDLQFKNIAEREYLIFNLLSSGKVAWDSGDFGSPSFTTVNSGGALNGGSNTGGVYDAGSVSVTIGTFTASVPYGNTGNSTAAQVSNTMEKAWINWSSKQNFSSEDQLAFAPFNRMTWYATTGWTKPYPGDSKVMTPAEVLAKYPQTTVIGGSDNDIPVSAASVPHSSGRK